MVWETCGYHSKGECTVSLERPLGTTKEARYAVSRETCGYCSRGEEHMVLLQRDPWAPQQTAGIWCLSRGGLCQPLTDNLLRVNNMQFCTKVHCAGQEHCHVCLGSHLTKPCLSFVVTSKTAAIHVRWQQGMCNFLVLQSPRPAA